MKFLNKMKVKFFVDEEKGVVVAKLLKPASVVSNIWDVAETIDVDQKYQDYQDLRLKVFNCRGIARCSPEDNFDIAIGKKIALNRLKIKVAKLSHNHLEKAFRQMVKKVTNLNDDLTTYCQNVEERLNKIYDIVGNKN